MNAKAEQSSINITIDNEYKFDDDYFNFKLNDIELTRIEKIMLEQDKEKAQLATINFQFDEVLSLLKQNLSQMVYPYLKQTYYLYFSKIKDKTSQKYFLLLTLGHKDKLFEQIYKFYHNLIKTKNFGISEQVKQSLNSDVLSSKEYLKFISSLAYWHSYSEFIILYLSLIEDIYGDEYSFDTYKFSVDSHLNQISLSVLTKKNLYKLAGTILSVFSINPNIDFTKIQMLVSYSMVFGLNPGAVLSVFPLPVLEGIAGAFAVNFLIGKASGQLLFQAKFVEFRVLAEVIEKLNKKLINICKCAETYLTLKLKGEYLTNIEKQLVMPIEKAYATLREKISAYLDDVQLDEEKEKECATEMIDISKKYSNISYEGGWEIICMKKEEVENYSKTIIEKKESSNNTVLKNKVSLNDNYILG